MKRYKLGDLICGFCCFIFTVIVLISNPFDFNKKQPLPPRVSNMQQKTLEFLRSCEIIKNSETVEIKEIEFGLFLGKGFEVWVTDGVFTVVDDKGNLCEHEFMVTLDYFYDEGIKSRYLWLDYDISYRE